MNSHEINEERLKILEMLSEGKLSTDEADLLLDALAEESPTSAPARWLCVRVEEKGRERVHVNIPISLARMGVALLPEAAMVRINEKGIDLYSILDEKSTPGRIVDIRENDHAVEVYLD